MLSSDPKDISYFVHLCICIKKNCRIHKTNYLGYFLSEDQSDDAEISKQIRTLYIRDQTSYCECLVIAP